MDLPVTFHDAIDHAELGKYKVRTTRGGGGQVPIRIPRLQLSVINILSVSQVTYMHVCIPESI